MVVVVVVVGVMRLCVCVYVCGCLGPPVGKKVKAEAGVGELEERRSKRSARPPVVVVPCRLMCVVCAVWCGVVYM